MPFMLSIQTLVILLTIEADDPEKMGDSRITYYDIGTLYPHIHATTTNQRPADLGSTSQCRTISPFPIDPKCGVPIHGGRGGLCFATNTMTTFMVQFCCGTGDYTSASVKRDGFIESQANIPTFTSAILANSEGDLIMPHSVGDEAGDKFETFLEAHGLNASSMVKSRSSSGTPVYKTGYASEAAVERRACDKFTQKKVSITNEKSVSRTTTFGASVSDPWGIVPESTEFSTEESASQSYTYEFTRRDGQCGHVSFTLFYNCIQGTITDCDEGDVVGERLDLIESKKADGRKRAGRGTKTPSFSKETMNTPTYRP
ncbi:hypothetical protein BKA63DRAFT_557792 [Paraphoma chrysanthemicola]|nr:hypothetical protein BKA63DRAFT_557792 [Paraphoma chrysanthemicola]